MVELGDLKIILCSNKSVGISNIKEDNQGTILSLSIEIGGKTYKSCDSEVAGKAENIFSAKTPIKVLLVLWEDLFSFFVRERDLNEYLLKEKIIIPSIEIDGDTIIIRSETIRIVQGQLDIIPIEHKILSSALVLKMFS